MTWDTYRNRKEALREVLAIADCRREDCSAARLLVDVESAGRAFADEADLLLDLQMYWYQALSGQLDRVFSLGAEDPEAVAIDAWRTAARSMPGTRALLDSNADREELQFAVRKERELIARAAGVPAHHGDLIGHGERVIDLARPGVVHAPVEPPTREHGIFARIREALVA